MGVPQNLMVCTGVVCLCQACLSHRLPKLHHNQHRAMLEADSLHEGKTTYYIRQYDTGHLVNTISLKTKLISALDRCTSPFSVDPAPSISCSVRLCPACDSPSCCSSFWALLCESASAASAADSCSSSFCCF